MNVFLEAAELLSRATTTDKYAPAIRALIESSGDKASAQEEGKVTPSGSEIISDADARRLLSDAGYFRTEDDSPAPSPAPLPKEVEEAMDRLSHCVNNAHHIDPLQYLEPVPGAEADVELQKKCLALDWEALAVIKAVLRPRVVTRKWAKKLSTRINKIQFITCPNDATLDTVERTTDELGIEVSEGEMR